MDNWFSLSSASPAINANGALPKLAGSLLPLRGGKHECSLLYCFLVRSNR